MKTLQDLHPALGAPQWGADGKLKGMGEQALRVERNELRRLHELPEDVEIVSVLPERPRFVKTRALGDPPDSFQVYSYIAELPPEWVPYPARVLPQPRPLYLHIAHKYCYRGAEEGAPLCIEGFDDFLKRYGEVAKMEQGLIREVEEANRAGELKK